MARGAGTRDAGSNQPDQAGAGGLESVVDQGGRDQDRRSRGARAQAPPRLAATGAGGSGHSGPAADRGGRRTVAGGSGGGGRGRHTAAGGPAADRRGSPRVLAMGAAERAAGAAPRPGPRGERAAVPGPGGRRRGWGGPVRLNKALSGAGLGSRRAVEELVRAGRVSIAVRSSTTWGPASIGRRPRRGGRVAGGAGRASALLAAEQACRGGQHRGGPRRSPDGRRDGPRAARVFPSGASTGTPKGCCCSPTMGRWPTGSPTPGTASRSATWPRSNDCRPTRRAACARESSSRTGSPSRPGSEWSRAPAGAA